MLGPSIWLEKESDADADRDGVRGLAEGVMHAADRFTAYLRGGKAAEEALRQVVDEREFDDIDEGKGPKTELHYCSVATNVVAVASDGAAAVTADANADADVAGASSAFVLFVLPLLQQLLVFPLLPLRKVLV